MEEKTQDPDLWIMDVALVKEGCSMAVVIPAKTVRALNLKHGDRIRIMMKPRPQED